MKKILILIGILFSLNLMAYSASYESNRRDDFNGKIGRNLKKTENKISESKKEEILFQLGIPTAR